MPKISLSPVREFFNGLPPIQRWGLVGAVVAAVAAVFGLGLLVEGISSDRVFSIKSEKIADLAKENQAQKEQLEAAMADLRKESGTRERFREKSEFLHFYVHYILSNDATSRNTFADFVCALRRKSQDRNIHIDMMDYQISVDDLTDGGLHAVEKLLAANGLGAVDTRELLRRIAATPTITIRRRDPRVFGGESSQRSDDGIARLNRKLAERKVRISKTVTFFDSSSYDVPKPIAIAVHARPECAPP